MSNPEADLTKLTFKECAQLSEAFSEQYLAPLLETNSLFNIDLKNVASEKVSRLASIRELHLTYEQLLEKAATEELLAEVAYEACEHLDSVLAAYTQANEIQAAAWAKFIDEYSSVLKDSEAVVAQITQLNLSNRARNERVNQARKAANARHDMPGGSREKVRIIREIWASGKYTSKDRCAEEECRALNMSFSAARKALRGQPNPHTMIKK